MFVFTFLCMNKTINNFRIRFSTSCEMFPCSCEYVSFGRSFYCNGCLMELEQNWPTVYSLPYQDNEQSNLSEQS